MLDKSSPYTAAAISNYFIAKNQKEFANLTHLKLQKLLYFAQGWFMANYNMQLFNEGFEAWRLGPVVRSIYRELSGMGSNCIVNKINTVYADTDGKPAYGPPEIEDGDAVTKSFLDTFWRLYSPIDAMALSRETHREGGPWHQVYTLYGQSLPYGVEIPIDSVHKYFLGLKKSNELVN